MKKILLAAVLACSCLQTANAQQPQRSIENKKDFAEKMVERMDDALDLSDQQEKDLLKVYTDLFSGNTSMKAGDKQSHLKAKKEIDEKVKAILTADQQKKWAEIKMQQADKRKEAFKKNKEYKKGKVNKEDLAEKMVDRMDDALNLTDQQEDALEKVYTEYLSGNKSLKTADKQTRINARKELNEKVNAILTADQQKIWTEIKKTQAEKRKEAFKNRQAK